MVFDEKEFRSYLPKDFGRRIVCFPETDSTNTRLVEAVRRGAAGYGDIFIAGSQTSGRGRRGKSFLSPDGGIYLSFCVNNNSDSLTTVICGVAVSKVLEKHGLSPEIKWVNDVLLGGKKVCGILAEAISGTSYAALGIGINVHEKDIPKEISDIAASLDAHINGEISKEKIAGSIISEFSKLTCADRSSVIAEYRKRLRFLGSDIRIISTGEICKATDVSENGELIVKKKNGDIAILNSGEISISEVN